MDSQSSAGGSAASSSDFVRKLYKMLEDSSYDSVVRWGDGSDSFVVLENEKFTKSILPKHFKHSNFASFVRQLNKYDFHKVRHNDQQDGQSPYGPGAWEFRHPDFKANNKDALDNIRRKAPVPRKANQPPEELVPTQQMDLVNTQLVATQQQLQSLQDKYNELNVHQSMLLQEVIGLQKTVVNHEHVMQNVMSFLHSVDAQRRRESRVVNPFAQNGNINQSDHQASVDEDDGPASPLQNADKLLQDLNADVVLNSKNLEHMNEMAYRMNGNMTTPPSSEAAFRNGRRPPSRTEAPHSATSSVNMRFSDLENVVYPVGQNNGIDPMYSEHIHNIPYPMPSKPAEPTDPRFQTNQSEAPKKKGGYDPGWIRQPQILLVEDDQTCRKIGGKFLYAFHCAIDSALDGLEAVNKMNAGSKYDLVLMDIIMPNLDGVSACHLIRQFDNTPIIAMTSNIRSDDISMYFQHGMNDVLPKPFTKDGLLSMLEKHLAHLKKPPPGMENMPHNTMSSGHHSMKDEDSPGKSPATLSTNWNSPAQLHGMSPVQSSVSDEYAAAVHRNANGPYGPVDGVPSSANSVQYTSTPHTPITGPRPHQTGSSGPYRRQIGDISGGESGGPDMKRQHMYPTMTSSRQ